MALPNASLIQTGLQKIYAAFAEDKTEWGMRTAVNHLAWLTGTLNRLYGVPVNVAVTVTDLGVSEFIAENGDGYDAGVTAIGDVFRNTGALDIDDGALLTAKGSALAAGDVFVISGADAVVYLGNNSGIVFDVAGESAADFKSIGS